MPVRLRVGGHHLGHRHMLGAWQVAAVAAIACFAAGCGDSDSAPDVPIEPDARLESLVVGDLALAPAFDPDILQYTAASAGFQVDSVEITASSLDPAAAVEIDGSPVPAGSTRSRPLETGTNTVEIDVVNGTATRHYTVAIARRTLAQLQSLGADVPNRDMGVGLSLSADGDVAVTGAADNGNARGINVVPVDQSLVGSGAAFAYSRDGAGTWRQEAYFKASNADAGDAFGYSAAFAGDTAVVGAPGEDSSVGGINGNEADNSLESAGAAYVFVRNTDGTWTQQAYLKPPDPLTYDKFGYSVAIDGDTIAVSASRESQGVIYFFTRDAGGNWAESGTVIAEDDAWDVAFADALALDGDSLAVGAKWHGMAFEGAVYMFRRDGSGNWSQEDLLVASNTGADDSFGASVALHEGTLVVGALQEASAATGIGGNGDDNSAPYAGAAYVFVRNASGDWDEHAYLKSSNNEADDLFGQDVAVHGDWVAVAAPNEGSAAAGIEGDQSDNSLAGSGAVYLFHRNDAGTWSQAYYVKAALPRANARFGIQISLTARDLAIAAPLEDGVDGNRRNSGVVHFFE